jgi:hypothetical protein
VPAPADRRCSCRFALPDEYKYSERSRRRWLLAHVVTVVSVLSMTFGCPILKTPADPKPQYINEELKEIFGLDELSRVKSAMNKARYSCLSVLGAQCDDVSELRPSQHVRALNLVETRGAN